MKKEWIKPVVKWVMLEDVDIVTSSDEQDPIKNNTAAEGANQGSEIIWQ